MYNGIGNYGFGDLTAWSQPAVFDEAWSGYGPFHPAVLWHVATSDSQNPPYNQAPAQVQQVAKVALWGIPVALLVGAGAMHFWMKRKKRR